MTAPADCPPRYSTPRTPERPTLGKAAAKVAEKLGTSFMPWQQHVMDVALEIDPVTRRFVYREVILTVPRQSGKTTVSLSLILTRALARPSQNIRYTAQTRSDARKKWSEDWLPVLRKSPFHQLFHVRLANGDESLIFNNGSRQGLLASTERAGHGSTLDLAILDEAFAQRDARAEQAMKPAMITRPDPQLWVVSTAGTKTMSPYLWAKVENGREIASSGMNTAVAYFEWSAAEDLDPADPATWRTCMPALNRTASEEAVAADFASMDLHEFQRAYLNQWTTAVLDPVIPLALWNGCEDPGAGIEGPVVLAVDATPDRAYSSISAAGRKTGDPSRIHVELVEHNRGLNWLVPRLKDLLGRHDVRAIVWDPVSPVGSKTSELEELLVERRMVSAKELGQACGMFYDAVVVPEGEEQTLSHLGDPELLRAMDGAVKQALGDAWKWSRKGSSVDISPLVAATLAHWGAATLEPAGAEVWDLNEIVARLRRERAGEEPQAPPQPGRPAPPAFEGSTPGPTTHPSFVPL